MKTYLKEVLRLSSKVTLLPVVHGSGDFALEVRRLMLNQSFDCLAVPLPASFQPSVERAILRLPRPMIVLQRERPTFSTEWSPEESKAEDLPHASYVPIDPCQGIIMGVRIAMQERIKRYFIDLETNHYEAYPSYAPDPYALKNVALEKYLAAVLPTIRPLPSGQPEERIATMANRLRTLEKRYNSILCLCSLCDWPWLRQAYHEAFPPVENDEVDLPRTLAPDPKTYQFLLGELPFLTAIYERARVELEPDENLSIDGIKELFVTARKRYLDQHGQYARTISPHLLKLLLKYVRNLSLIENRLTPSLYSLVVAAQQMAGDTFAQHVLETSQEYLSTPEVPEEKMVLGIDQGRMPDGEMLRLTSRLAGPPVVWQSLALQKRPERREQQRWAYRWNRYGQCSWPPEDDLIERFRTAVQMRAQASLGIDLAKTEKFSASLKDGLDMRETLRNWHTGELYVKELPPTRGHLNAVVMLFDTPADPREYPWRTTWYAEHQNESTLCFFGTHFDEMVGPGIAVAKYGGALFLFPPQRIPDIWSNREFDFADTLEDRLIAAASKYSESRNIALLSAQRPTLHWKQLAKRYGKRFVHVPLHSFNQAMIAQLRIMHVLNGHHVRSYAAQYIRKI
ncbi:Hypothetical protein PBC10988_38580 [Planctomycetales bacterium 10988]|nr:Hypothetical protein PBC10988_38580 [Planctomycetales bacterium 10988]